MQGVTGLLRAHAAEIRLLKESLLNRSCKWTARSAGWLLLAAAQTSPPSIAAAGHCFHTSYMQGAKELIEQLQSRGVAVYLIR